MKILMLGKPASGKGTISQMLMKDDPNTFQLSTGDLLRAEQATGSELGMKIKSILDKGGYLDDDTIYKLMGKVIEEKKDVPLIFDGYPRTLKQAADCQKNGIIFDKIFLFEVTDDLVRERVLNRRVHPGSGRVYNIKTKPPLVDGFDDVTGEPLITRDDDKLEVLENRLKNHRELTEPIADYLRAIGYNIEVIDGTTSLQEQYQKVRDSLDGKNDKKMKFTK